MCQRWSWGSFESRCFIDRPKRMAPSRPRSRKNVHQAVCLRFITPRLRDSMQLLFMSEYADHSSLETGLFTTMAHTTRRLWCPRDEAMRHALLPSSETHALHGSAKPSMANVLLRMWVKFIQHKHENPAAKRDPPCPLTKVASSLSCPLTSSRH